MAQTTPQLRCWRDDVRITLFVVMRDGAVFDDALERRIRATLSARGTFSSTSRAYDKKSPGSARVCEAYPEGFDILGDSVADFVRRQADAITGAA